MLWHAWSRPALQEVPDGVMKILVGRKTCCQVRRINAVQAMLAAISSITVGLVGRKALYAGLPWVINRGGKYSARLACPALARRFRRGEQEGQETHHRGTEAQRLHREKLFLLYQNGISLPLDSILDGFLCVSAPLRWILIHAAFALTISGSRRAKYIYTVSPARSGIM